VDKISTRIELSPFFMGKKTELQNLDLILAQSLQLK
jgi:hypothetical protein